MYYIALPPLISLSVYTLFTLDKVYDIINLGEAHASMRYTRYNAEWTRGLNRRQRRIQDKQQWYKL